MPNNKSKETKETKVKLTYFTPEQKKEIRSIVRQIIRQELNKLKDK